MKFLLFLKGKYLRGGAIFIVGFIVGAATINAFIGKKIDNLYFENSELKEELETIESEILELEESLKKRRYFVTSIEPFISFREANLTEYEKETVSLELQKEIKEMLSELKGKEVDKIDYNLIPLVIDNRSFVVDGKTYLLKVEMIVISQKIIIYVDAKLKTAQEEAV